MIDVTPGAPGLGFVVKRVWVFLVQHGDGDEAVPAFQRGTVWYPMVAADEERLALYRETAKDIVRTTGKPIRLAVFETRVDLETFEP